MSHTKYLLIGGGLASCTAIEGIRMHDSSGPITLVSTEPHLPYHRPPLTKGFMQGKKPLEKAYCQGREWFRQNHVDLMLALTVERLDAAQKVAHLSNGQQVGFEKALIATGGRPAELKLPGIDLGGVYYFRTMDQALAVSNEVANGRRAVVIGGGFIGMELASSFTQRGVAVTLVHSGPHIWSNFLSADLAGWVRQRCEAQGVVFYTDQRASRIEGAAGRCEAVLTTAGHRLPCDLVVAAVGIVPNVELAQQAGLAVDNGIVVDEFCRSVTSPDIFAAGDNMNFPDPHFGARRRVEHWGQADYSGRLAGENMAGAGRKYELLTYIFSDVFDMHIEMAGDESLPDRTIIRGDMDDKGFIAIGLKDGRVVAYFAVNGTQEEQQALNALIEHKLDFTGRENELADLDTNLQHLAGTGAKA